jgi:hypothetical protein
MHAIGGDGSLVSQQTLLTEAGTSQPSSLLFLYIQQLIISHRISLALSNTLYLIALNYYFIITFLGYNALPFLHHTELLLAPIAVTTILWFTSLFGMNLSKHLAPVFLTGARLRKGD